MIIKQPACYDVSHWDGIINWANVAPKPILVFCKATEGNYYKDETFAPNMSGLSANGILRGVYHFHRKANTPETQAKYFCDYVRSVLIPNDFIALDVEEGSENAAQLKAWFEYVRAQFPKNPFILYSRKNILDPIVMTEAQRFYFNQIPVWTAGYPDNPDLFNSPPNGYVPDQTKFGPVYVWQYSEHGKVSGIVGDADLDCLSPEFIARLNVPPVPPTGETMTRYFTIKGTPVTPPALVMNIRAGASASTADLGDLFAGDKIEVSETVTVSATDKWGKLAKITRANGLDFPLPAPVCYVSLNTTNTIETFPQTVKVESLTIEPAPGTVLTWLMSDGTTKKETV